MRGPRTVLDSESVSTIRGCRSVMGFRRSRTPNVPQGFVDVEAPWASAAFGPEPRCAPKHRGPQTVVGQGRITQATFSCLSALYSMLMLGQRSALEEINATRNRNVGISPFKVSIGQRARTPQTFENPNARVTFIFSITRHPGKSTCPCVTLKSRIPTLRKRFAFVSSITGCLFSHVLCTARILRLSVFPACVQFFCGSRVRHKAYLKLTIANLTAHNYFRTTHNSILRSSPPRRLAILCQRAFQLYDRPFLSE